MARPEPARASFPHRCRVKGEKPSWPAPVIPGALGGGVGNQRQGHPARDPPDRGSCCGPCGAADCARPPNVRLPIPIAAVRAPGRLSQLSAINRHNQQLFDLLVGAHQN